MFFQPKLIIGCVAVLGIGIPSYLFSDRSCSNPYIVIPWNIGFGSTNSILDCKDDSNSRNYSIYLVFKEERDNHPKVATFKVVDNNTQKIMWGHDSDKNFSWDQWGIISSYKETTAETGPEGEKKSTTEIRVPTKRKWREQNITISCQKSMVQMKKGAELVGTNSGNKQCTGSLLRSKNMNFELLKSDNCRQGWFGKRACNVNLSDKFEWYLGTPPQAILCNS